MNLEMTLDMLAAQLHIDADQLAAYAREDLSSGVGGYHFNPALSKWDTGSLFEVEGAILYALVRTFKPQRVAEIGGLWGCSTAHLAAALKANGGGKVLSIDSGALGAEHGAKIPAVYREFVQLIAGDGEAVLKTLDDQSLGMVFSDADHATETTRRIAAAAIPKLVNDGLFIEHDAAHDFAIIGGGGHIPANEGRAIRAGLDAAGLDYRVYLTEPSDCGFGVAQVKHETMVEKPAPQSTVVISQDIPTVVFPEAPIIPAAEGIATQGESNDWTQSPEINKGGVPDERPADSYESETYTNPPKKRGRKAKAKAQ